jgi:hypothetical protein
MGFHRSLEMSVSRDEFFRLLPAAVGSFGVDGDTIRGRDEHRAWVIRLVPLADCRVGSLVVPRHRVDIVIDDCAEEEAEAFMSRFRRGFLHGGG